MAGGAAASQPRSPALNHPARESSLLSLGAQSDCSNLSLPTQLSGMTPLSRLSDLTDEAAVLGARVALPPVVESPRAAGGGTGGVVSVASPLGARMGGSDGGTTTIRITPLPNASLPPLRLGTGGAAARASPAVDAH